MMKQLSKILLTLLCIFAVSILNAQTGTWTVVKNAPPHNNMGVCLLMTDGTVICHDISGGGNGFGWDRLTPDIHGSYANGTWDTIAPMNNDRLFFSSQVLPSGKVYVAGGEYGAGGTNGEVYDPVTNIWSMCGPVPTNWNVYDGNSELLYNGNVLEGPQIGATPSYDILTWSPVTNQYTIQPSAFYNHDEAEWLKLPDSSVLFVGIASQFGNRYIPKYNKWVLDDTTPGDLYDPYGEEAGCALMLPNGKAIFFGATPYNCIYTPSGDTNHGTWISADSFPVIQGTYMGQADASGAMMVNGHILLAVSPIGTSPQNEFNSPAYFVEYNYLTDSFTQVMDTLPLQHGDSIPYIGAYQTQMLDLPDGTVLVSVSQTDSAGRQYYIYTPGSGPIAQGKPTINSISNDSCLRYRITGKLFNGISEGAAYGDDWQMSTNWPLVRLTNGGNTYYCKTTNWNRIGAVQTDSAEDTAYFTVPGIPGGSYSLSVVVNGFASNPVPFTTFGLSITAQTNISTCLGTGSATVTASHGTTPYTYLWSPNGGTNATANNLIAGTYTITVTESGGCSVSTSVTITQPGLLHLSPTFTSVSCVGGNNGSASANASGGTMPYTYTWTGGGTSASVSNLSAGNYVVSVLDSCNFTASALVTIPEPGNLSIFPDSIVNENCGGQNVGSAYVFAFGGTPQYTYNWSPSGGTNAGASGLTAGNYTITVTDSCGISASAQVNISQPAPLTLTMDSIATSSNVNCTGAAKVIASGGTPPYAYLWSPNGQTTSTIYNQCSGRYCVTVTDTTGCTATKCVHVKLNNGLGIQNINGGDGAIELYPNPSNGVFTISITNYELGITDQVEIYNMLGQKVHSQLIMDNGQWTINISDNPNGIYLYRVITETGSLVAEGKFVIQK